MAKICQACSETNQQDSNFCRMCGVSLASSAEFEMNWGDQHPNVRSRTASQNSMSHLMRSYDDGGSPMPGSRRNSMQLRNEDSYQLLMRLQAAGPEWREVESSDGVRSPSKSPVSSPRRHRRSSLKDKAKILENVIAQPSQNRWGAECNRFVNITEMSPAPSFPRILCVARRYLRKNKYVDITGEFHLDLIQQFGGAPIIIPRTMTTVQQLTEYLPMDGLVIAEGNDLSDDILLKYGCQTPQRLEGEAAAKWASDTELDVPKDELEFALMRFALAAGVPIMSFCRGSQMLNVLRGGSLIGDIPTQTDSRIPHARDSGEADYDSYRHPISVIPETPLADWFADSLPQDGSNELLVNSYHHQASKELGSSLVPMAHSPDGLIEGFYDPSYDPKSGNFVVGLQFHPERMLDDYPGCSRCYESFLEAARAYKQQQDCEA